MKLIILAAGKGTRFLPTTNTIPKGMIPILGEPLLKYVVTPYLPYVSDIFFVVNDSTLSSQIKNYFKENYIGHNVLYRTQVEHKGTMDALLTCKNAPDENELFCVVNGDDLLHESDIKNALEQKIIGLGISKKIMPKSYFGIEVKDGYVSGFKKHDTNDAHIEDMYYNGFNILDSKVFNFEPAVMQNGEFGLPHTLFAHLETYTLKAFTFESWETVNRPEDIANAEKFIQSL